MAYREGMPELTDRRTLQKNVVFKVIGIEKYRLAGIITYELETIKRGWIAALYPQKLN